MMHNELCLTPEWACCGLRNAISSLWPSETKGRKCLTDIVKKTRLLSAVGLHVDVLREVVGLSRFHRRRNKLTQKQQHPENFDRQQQTKATWKPWCHTFISVDCVVSIWHLLSISFLSKQREGLSFKTSKIRPEEANLVWGAAFLQNHYRD